MSAAPVTPRIDGEYLLLDIADGSDALVELHERLYAGTLARYRARTRSYRPHITIGRSADRHVLAAAMTEARVALPQTINAAVEQVSIFRLDDATHGQVQDSIDLIPRASHA